MKFTAASSSSRSSVGVVVVVGVVLAAVLAVLASPTQAFTPATRTTTPPRFHGNSYSEYYTATELAFKGAGSNKVSTEEVVAEVVVPLSTTTTTAEETTTTKSGSRYSWFMDALASFIGSSTKNDKNNDAAADAAKVGIPKVGDQPVICQDSIQSYFKDFAPPTKLVSEAKKN
mmetsp:Transcript_34812/g.99076  ORF Transcript_34812/g.99076 Transcript_34812/m.99076 type:complete len:173 (-) Transcript_34812:63-581(-)